MKIGVSTFGGDGGKSGISQYIVKLLSGLAELDQTQKWEVIVYKDEQSIFLPSSANVTPIAYGGHLRNPVANIAWHQIVLPRVCRRKEIDVLFLPAGNRRLPFSIDCPSVGTVHDLSSIHVAEKYDPLRTTYIKHVLPHLIRRLTHVITCSESSREDIIEYGGVPRERISVIPHGVDHDIYVPHDRDDAAARVLSKYGIRHPYILYVSRIEHPGKNHVRLIHAFTQLKERARLPHQMVLAGSDWSRAEEVHGAAAQSSAVTDILFTGFVPDVDLPRILGCAELFVFPSLYEGFGLPILEAMACGVPVACSNLSSMPEVAGDAAVMFDPYNEGEIAAAIMQTLTDSELRHTMIERGIKRSRLYTWDETARRTLRVIQSAAREGPRR